MQISLAPEVLFVLGPVTVTNSLFTAIVVSLLIITFFFFLNRKLSYENPGKLQLVMEMLVSAMRNLVLDILGEEKGKKLFGFVFTFFVFILISNWFGLLPITPSLSVEKSVEEHIVASSEPVAIDTEESHELSLGYCLSSKHCYLTTEGIEEFHEPVHIFRAPTSDLSLAITFALISIIVTNFLGFKYLKGKYAKKYINFSSPINGFVGILEIVSEIGKIVSFSFRLFGNVFAGEILLLVITSISFGVATLPFLGLELFVGFIQALVFLMLTTVFIGLATTHTEH